MTEPVPAPLATMRAITEITEEPGAANNPVILGWADQIARRFPEMAAYARQYTADSIAWCGHTMGYVMAKNGIRPPYVPGNDLKSYLWAESWADFGTPVDRARPGDVLVLSRHVTMCDGEDGDVYLGRGGNQSDQVKVSRYAKSAVKAIRRPLAPSAPQSTGDKPMADPAAPTPLPPGAPAGASFGIDREKLRQMIEAMFKEAIQGIVPPPVARPVPTLEQLDARLEAVEKRLAAPAEPPAPAAPVVVQPAPSVLEKPSVQLSAAGLAGSLLAMAGDVLGTPFGAGTTPTTTGTLATLIPMATGLIGATGGFGTIAKLGLGIVGSILSRTMAKKS